MKTLALSTPNWSECENVARALALLPLAVVLLAFLAIRETGKVVAADENGGAAIES